MAIALDTSAYLNSVVGTSLTTAYTCSGTGRILFVGITGDTTNDDVSSVAYGGVAMTRIATSVLVPSDRYIYLYGLGNPGSGANNVVITTTNSHYFAAIGASYTGASGSIDVSTTNTVASGTTLSGTVTTTLDNDWTIIMAHSGGGSIAAGASTTLRQAGDGNSQALLDSNAAITPAGATTLTYTQSGVAIGMGLVMAAFSPTTPPAAGGFSSYRSLLGVGG